MQHIVEELDKGIVARMSRSRQFMNNPGYDAIQDASVSTTRTFVHHSILRFYSPALTLVDP